MRQLYRYHGTVSSIGYKYIGHKGHADIILGDISDWDKAPIRVEAHGKLADYINGLQGTDAEERYIKSDWYYDRNLYLQRIEIPKRDGRLAKVIAHDFLSNDRLEIFGPQDYIETNDPEPMDDDQAATWCEYQINQ